MAVRCLFSEDWIGRFPKGDICQGLQFTHGWRGKLTSHRRQKPRIFRKYIKIAFLVRFIVIFSFISQIFVIAVFPPTIQIR